MIKTVKTQEAQGVLRVHHDDFHNESSVLNYGIGINTCTDVSLRVAHRICRW